MAHKNKSKIRNNRSNDDNQEPVNSNADKTDTNKASDKNKRDKSSKSNHNKNRKPGTDAKKTKSEPKQDMVYDGKNQLSELALAALEDYDPNETRPQLAEHYVYSDSLYKAHGHF